MVFFKKTKKGDCRLAIVPQRDGIAVAAVAHAGTGRPVVESAAFFQGEANAEVLERIGKAARAATFDCTTLLGVGNYQLLSVEAPNVPADELKTAVRWRLKDLIDFPVSDATIDVLRIPPGPNAASRPQQMMFAVAARNTALAPRQQLFAAAKIGLSVVDIPETAQRNIAALLEPEGRGLAMLTFDDDGALLTVTYGGELYLVRRIDMAPAMLTDADIERRHQAFDRITLELQRSLDNFERQYSFISVSKLLLGPSTITGLDEYLSSNLYVPVDSLDLAEVFDLERVPELADKAQQQRFFPLLGAGLRREGGQASQQIDLYNPQFEYKRKLFGAVAMAQALLLLLAGVLAMSFYGGRGIGALEVAAREGAQSLEKKKRELEAVNTDFPPREKSPELEAQLAENEAQLAALKRIAAAVDRGDLGNANGYSEYFKALARQHVDGLWLTGLAITGAGCDIGVRGRAVDASLLPGFLGNLTREKIMQGKSFGSLQIGHPEQPPSATSSQPAKDDKDGKSAGPAAAPYVEFSLQSKPEGAQS